MEFVLLAGAIFLFVCLTERKGKEKENEKGIGRRRLKPKMHAKGSNIGNSCRQMPGNFSSFDPNLPPQRGFDLSHQYNRTNEVGFLDWHKDPGISHCRNLIRNIMFSIFGSQLRYDQEQASVLANILEYWLFIAANSQAIRGSNTINFSILEEYMNQDTFMQRVETLLKKLHATKCSEQVDSFTTYTSKMVPSSGLFHPWSNGSVLEPAFQNVSGPVVNATDYSAVAVDNKYGFPKGGLSHSSVVHRPVLSPDIRPAIATCTGMGVFSNFSFSVGKVICKLAPSQFFITGNRQTIVCVFESYGFLSLNLYMCTSDFVFVTMFLFFLSSFARTIIILYDVLFTIYLTALAGEMDLIKYGDCSGTMQKSDSMAYINMGKSLQSDSSNLLASQHVSREFSQVSNLSPGLSIPGDIRQYQHQKLDFQQINDKTNIAQPNSFLENHGKHSCQNLGPKTLKQSQHFKRSVNGDKQFTSESLVDHFDLDGSAYMNASSSSKLSVEQMILLQHFYYRNLNIIPQGNVLKCLHSRVCCKENLCNCERYRMLLLHFDECQNDACHICYSWNLLATDIVERRLEFPDGVFGGFVVRKRDAPCANFEAMQPTAKRQKMESAFGVSLINNVRSDWSTPNMVQHCSSEALLEPRTEFNQDGINATKKIIEPKADQEKETKSSNRTPKADQEKETKAPNRTVNTVSLTDQARAEFNQDVINVTKKVIEPKSDQEKETTSQNPTVYTVSLNDQGRTEFDGINATMKVIGPKADQEKETKSPNPTVNTVSLIDFFTSNEITEHIASLTKQSNQSTTDEESADGVNKCQLCEAGSLSFAPVPIYCLRCGNRIKRNSNYYYRREEDDTEQFFCTTCYRTARGGNITFNERFVSKTDLHKMTNNGVCEEGWVECNKCKSWQHQICALYNDKRDLDYSAEYTCPVCRLKEIKNGMHVPLPKTAMFGAKDLPSTMLSDHIEKRLLKRLMQESEDWAKVEGNKNFDEVLVAENLSVRVVLSVDKELKVKKQFLDIFEEEDYPAEFSYTSKNIEGVDVCLFAMYVQEFGSECGYPNQRSVYLSYLDSVKYFRPERVTSSGEALRTFVYHEILTLKKLRRMINYGT
ncbi:putative histone acetyltransferase HAC-like 1, partial [Mucuna pruriens]